MPDLDKLLAEATRGPWQVDGVRKTGDLKIGTGTRLHFVGPDGDAVAAVFFDMKTGRGYTDARLIALAPQLAAALIKAEEALAELSCLGNGERPGNSTGNMIARAALSEIRALTGGGK